MPDTLAENNQLLTDPERMADRARRLARSQSVTTGVRFVRPPRLLLRESYRGLSTAYRRLVEAAREEAPLTPSAEWLLDNFYVIRDAVRQLREDLPWSYYRVLPKLEGGPFSGRPRVYELMHALAGRTDNVLDAPNVMRFMRAFQEVTLLELGELWAIPAMLRLVMLQQLSALAAQVSATFEQRAEAEEWARKIVARAEADPAEVVVVLADMAERYAPISGAFAVQLSSALRAAGPSAAPAIDWLERRLEARGTTLEEVARQEAQEQTHRQASVANAITSLRRAPELDWAEIVESLSSVEQALKRDPAGVYPEVDFNTRDRYRHVVEDLARHAPASEVGVAERAVAMAEMARDRWAAKREAEEPDAPDVVLPIEAHVGYYLVDAGRPALEREVAYRAPAGRWIIRAGRRRPTLAFVGTVTVLLAGLMAGAFWIATNAGATVTELIITIAVAFLPALDLAISLTNWVVTRIFPPRRLPRLAFDAGVPADCRTFIVVPTILTSPANARAQVEHLEVHALANPDAEFRFALLTDVADAADEVVPGDATTVETAREAIHALNERWRKRDHAGSSGGPDAPDRFFLLHRSRRWNPQEGVWMGWERKRGKIEEFNALLRRPDAETTYSLVEGDLAAATAGNAVRYVITLDADTHLPPGAAADLVRTAAHPLNRPRYDRAAGRVTRGYGILQPRVGISAGTDLATPFARIFSGNVGVDAYTTATSDIYQDLFGVGIFTGKGLYDVDAFHDALDGQIPENTVLSHDLLEGNYARTALLSDVVVFDAYPSSYTAHAKRLHRWVRGDWQILPWLFPLVRTRRSRWRRNPVPLLGRWKMFDNLRRSLTAPALMVFLILGWTVLPGSPFLWTLMAVGILAFPIYAPFTSAILSRPKEARWISYLRSAFSDSGRPTAQSALSVAFLAHQAMLMLDAVTRTIWRMAISRKRRLEWTTAHQAELAGGDAPGIWLSTAWGAAVVAMVGLMDPTAWLVSMPFAAAWIAAPWVARRVSRPTVEEVFTPSPAERASLRLVARRFWRYFDQFITEEDSWLPPDNYQERPFIGLARRTSPTNIGMGLLSVQSAADLGYATRTDTIERLDSMLQTLGGMECHLGHFYNWYSTETAEALHPRYVSTVDSGNLAASLLTLRQALLETPNAPWPSPAVFEGLRDTVAALHETLAGQEPSDVADGVHAAAAALAAALPSTLAASTTGFHEALLALVGPAEKLAASAEDLATWPEAARAEARYWAMRPAAEIGAALTEILRYAPWVGKPDVPEHLAEARTLGALALAYRRAPAQSDPSLEEAGSAVRALLDRATRLASAAERLALGMNFRPLYDEGRGLLAVGYNSASGQFDPGTYDLLASEARVTSLIAIGKGDVPVEHWFRLSRPTTVAEGERALISWSGTMFEYLMPLLFARTYPETLLDETCRSAVAIQRAYGRRRSRPWGVSESAYYTLDLGLTYQYRAFGVPGLGLKRGLADDYVVAPYATLLALMVKPAAALRNLERLREAGGYGPYGFYESIDYTKERLPAGQDHAVVRTYMAHHHGMSLLSLANMLLDDVVQRRFSREPLVRSVDLLLQERLPREVDFATPHPDELDAIEPMAMSSARPAVVHIPARDLDGATPTGLLLSNGRHTSFVTAAGAGYAHVHRPAGAPPTALTRWAPDRTAESDGIFLYVRDLDSGRFWSAGRQPVAEAVPDRYEAWLHLNKLEIARVDDWIETFTEVAVSPEDDVELRRYTLTNYGEQARRIELTSYAEVVLAAPAADSAHPAFSKLFVRTEAHPEIRALLASRRSRKEGELPPWLFHVVGGQGAIEMETDRARFVGRNRTLAHPAALDPGGTLSGTVGPVLDPIVSLRRTITLAPKERVVVTYALGTAETREAALRLADRYGHPTAVERAFDLAVVYGLVELPHLRLSGEQALYAQRLGAALLYGSPRLRAPERVLLRNRRPQSGLWAYGISGDLPLIVVRVGKVEEVEVVRLLLQCHAYWRQKGLLVDLLVLNEHPPSYADEVQKLIQQAIETSPARGLMDQRGGVFLRRAEGLPDEDLALMLTVARAVIEGGSMPAFDVGEPTPALTALDLAQEATPSARQRLLLAAADALRRESATPPPTPAPAALPAGADGKRAQTGEPAGALQFENGTGGFTDAGRAYTIRLGGGGATATPLPWSNVVANEHFGFVATESGGGFTWNASSQQNRLTPWSNDPVVDPPGEILYLRDDEAGVYWSLTPEPVPGPGEYEIEHAFGATRYRHTSHQVESELTLFVPRADPVKLVRVRLTNTGDAPRKLSLVRYQAWVLDDRRERSAPFVTVQSDLATGALLAQNRYSPHFGSLLAFADIARLGTDKPVEGVTVTADRAGFLGRRGTPARPDALMRAASLDGRIGAGLDPCAAFMIPVTLEPGETEEFVCQLGQARSREHARDLVRRYRSRTTLDDALEEVEAFWDETLEAVQVSTPVPALDVMVNGWLLYQTLACRIWGRSAFYQSGGAFGFRDQLQDSMALVYTRPDLTHAQLLLHAAHQFEEGDVLHWWHEANGAGVRTRFADDLLWLPYATAFYLKTTGNATVLKDMAPFLSARPLEEGEDEAFLTPEATDSGTLFEHCLRAIDRSLTAGPNGLPLMGAGDWNDGMNRVGNQGRGESVWLGFFLYDVLSSFIPLCEANDEQERAERYAAYREDLQAALEDAGWDGDWYRRAYYDDGTPLGSAQNVECRIDAIAQAWSVISDAADPDRADTALQSANKHLVDDSAGIIRLLTPPFDTTDQDPGYIKGYVPGVRENGGQYTHGALWLIRAFAERGQGTRAAELLEMLLPVSHALTPEATAVYKTEPYSVAADVYGAEPHVGRGGWTWYTGAAGWMYRIALESVLGFTLEGESTLRLDPRIPAAWPEFKVTYRPGGGATVYEVSVENPHATEVGVATVEVDGKSLAVDAGVARIPLRRDGRRHHVRVVMGAADANGVSEKRDKARPQRSEGRVRSDENL